MKKTLLAILAILLIPALSFAGGLGGIFAKSVLPSLSYVDSATFEIPESANSIGAIVTITGSTNTRLLLFGCEEYGDKNCVGDNITILNADTNTNTEAGTITYNAHIGDNASSATAAVTANTVTNNRARSSAYLSDNMTSLGGTGNTGKFFFSIPVANFPPAHNYKIRAYERSATAGTISMELSYRD